MKHPAFKPSFALITISGMLLSNHAYSIETPIYKWQDNRGITQYSDRAPTVAYTKATRFEMINALQAKDLCTAPSTGSTVYLPKQNLATNTTPAYSANIFGGISNPFGINNPLASAARAAKAEAARATKAAKAAAKRASAAAKAAAKRAAASTKAAAKSIGGSSIGGSAFGPSASTSANAASKTAAAAQAAAAQAAAAQAVAAQAAAAQAVAAQAVAAQAVAAQAAAVQAAAVQAAAVQAAAKDFNPNLVQVGLMPAVDISKNMVPYLGHAEQRIRASKFSPKINPNADRFSGEFRIVCNISHMSNDDPILYPNQKGAAHHHTFYGNSSVDNKSNLMNLDSVGSGTCTGGTANRSAYWAPSMINTVTHEPIPPNFTIVYYKVGRVISEMVKAPPKGLRMITGNMKAKTEAEGQVQYSCLPPYGDGIPDSQQYMAPKSYLLACPAGWTANVAISFPQCWDGKNLDSPDHISHMASANRLLKTPNLCPESHPIAIPQITIIQRYTVPKGADLRKWRLSSDNYSASLPGGYSGHADWVNGWTPAVMDSIIKNCLNAKVDCGASLLGDGREIF